MYKSELNFRTLKELEEKITSIYEMEVENFLIKYRNPSNKGDLISPLAFNYEMSNDSRAKSKILFCYDSEKCLDVPIEKLDSNDIIGKDVKKHTFFKPIVFQDNLVAIGQFNFLSYIYDEELRIYPVIDFEGYEENYRNIFLFTEEYGFRSINPNTGRIEQEPLVWVRNFLDSVVSGRYWSRSYPYFYYDENDSPIHFFNKDMLDKLRSLGFQIKDDKNSGNSVLSFINKYEKPKSKRSGVHRFRLRYTEGKEEEIKKKVFAELSSVFSFGAHLDKYRPEGVEVLSEKEEKIDGVVVKNISYEGIGICNNCKNTTQVVGVKRTVENNQFYRDSSRDIVADNDIVCSKCHNLMAKKDEKLKTKDRQYFIVYDIDKKGRIIERIFEGTSVANKVYEDANKVSCKETARVIFYEKESPKNYLLYRRSGDEFIKEDYVPYYFDVVASEAILLQSKEEIKSLLSQTSYKYSGWEEILFSETLSLNKNIRGIRALSSGEDSYLMKYKENPSLEFIGRIDSLHYLLYEKLSNTLNTPNHEAKNAHEALGISKKAYRVLMSFDDITYQHYEVISYMDKYFYNNLSKELYDDFSDNDLLEISTIRKVANIHNNFNIKVKDILAYIGRVKQYQRIMDSFDILNIWEDYLRMAKEIGRELKGDLKYPNSLKREHDIVSYDYTQMKRNRDCNNPEHKELFNSFKKYEYSNDQYSIIAPKNANQVIEEGHKLNHCVASYVDDILNERVVIMFMRRKEDIDKPFYTIELGKSYAVIGEAKQHIEIKQVRGSSNKGLTSIEQASFIESYSKFLSNIS